MEILAAAVVLVLVLVHGRRSTVDGRRSTVDGPRRTKADVGARARARDACPSIGI